MKKLFNVLMLTLALDFLALAGAVGWLYKTGRLDRQRVDAIRAIVFPTTAPASTQPSEPAAAMQPLFKLDELLAQQAHRPAGEQVEFLQHTFDMQTAQLERRRRELEDLQATVETARQKLSSARTDLKSEQDRLAVREQEATKLQSDHGFQDSLKLYSIMPPKNAKRALMALGDETVVQYLRAMEPRASARIVKEFKTSQELERIQRVLETMRRAGPTTKE